MERHETSKPKWALLAAVGRSKCLIDKFTSVVLWRLCLKLFFVDRFVVAKRENSVRKGQGRLFHLIIYECFSPVFFFSFQKFLFKLLSSAHFYSRDLLISCNNNCPSRNVVFLSFSQLTLFFSPQYALSHWLTRRLCTTRTSYSWPGEKVGG